MVLPAHEAIDATVRRHFAFLVERGFILDPEANPKAVRRTGFQHMWYRGERWGIEIYLEYREGYYDVRVVPLEQGEPRQVPSGYRTRWGLQQYLTQILGVRDEGMDRLRELYEATSPLTERVTVEFADQVFALYESLLRDHLDEIVASPHPPIGRA
jgi:hypothetical protein